MILSDAYRAELLRKPMSEFFKEIEKNMAICGLGMRLEVHMQNVRQKRSISRRALLDQIGVSPAEMTPFLGLDHALPAELVQLIVHRIMISNGHEVMPESFVEILGRCLKAAEPVLDPDFQALCTSLLEEYE